MNKIKYQYTVSVKLMLISLLFATFFTNTSAQQQKAVNKQIKERGEVYLLVDIPNQKALNKLNKVASIDKRILAENSQKIYAYVSKNQIQEFENLELSYLLQTPPSLKLVATMCADLTSVKNWNCYPTYDQYLALMDTFVANYPDLCQLEEIGTSIDGRRVLSIKISDNVAQNETEPEFLYTSSMHGDEIAGYPLMLRLIDYLLSNYQTDNRIKELLDSTEIWINPLANPDGTYAAGNLDVTGATRSNSDGYDLNRNFPDPEDGDYPGGTRQKETQDMMDFMAAHNFVLSANFHGGVEVVNYPWDTWVQRHPDDVWYQNLSWQYADTVHTNSISGYMTYLDGVTNGYDWYSISGGRQDYANYFQGIHEVTIELSDVKTPDASTLPDLWNYNYKSLINYIDRTHTGLYGTVADSDNNPVEAIISIEISGTDKRTYYSSKNHGKYYGRVDEGTYTVSYSADGFKAHTVDTTFLYNKDLKIDVVLERETVSINDLTSNPIELKTINNPFTEYILANISLTDYSGDLNVLLYDSNGKLCKSTQLNNAKTGENSFYLETTDLRSGLYILQISTNQFAIKKKMIKP